MPSTPRNAATPARPCPHLRGHGTTVCLHCRAEAHAAAAARRRRVLARGGAIALSIAVVLGMGAGALAARTRAPAPAADPQTMTTTTSEKMVTLATTSARGAAAPAAVARPRVLAPAPVVAPTEPTAPTGAWTPVLATGRTELADSMYALNAVDGISVHFDTQDLRTRRRDKFEHVVRATLPAVYGARADSLLATIPDGQLAAGGDLLSELPTRGITLPARDGWAVTLWPATRPGRDGPLVVSYRVTARAR